MTNKQKQFARIKCQLIQRRENGNKEVIWKLSQEQREFVENNLGYRIIPWIYEISTTTIASVNFGGDSMMYQIYTARRRGQKKIYRKLKRREKKSLDDYGIRYRPFKYKIVLQ